MMRDELTRITVVASINVTHGYGQHALQMVRWLQHHGYFVSVRPLQVNETANSMVPEWFQQTLVRRIQPEPIEILLCPPSHAPTPGKATIYFTLCESPALTVETVYMLNLASMVTVPSASCGDTFLRCGVTVPVVVIPLGDLETSNQLLDGYIKTISKIQGPIYEPPPSDYGTPETPPFHSPMTGGAVGMVSKYNPIKSASVKKCGQASAPKLNGSIARPMKANPLLSKPAEKTVTAVVCVYKSPASRINRCLEALIPNVDEVVLSVDGSDELDVTPDPKIIRVKHSIPLRMGYASTANHGAKFATKGWLLLVNDDAYIQPETVNKMLAAVKDTSVGVVGCLLRYPDGRINHGGVHRKVNGRRFVHVDYRAEHQSIRAVTEMEAVTLGCALVRRDAFDQVGGFDEEFDCYYEDMDLCLKLRQAGWRILYTPHAEAIHEESQTSSTLGADFKRQKAEESALIMERKWGWYFDRNKSQALGTFR